LIRVFDCLIVCFKVIRFCVCELDLGKYSR